MASKKKAMEEVIIKSKKRVQNHGEVFTPRKTINQMLNMKGIKEACNNLTSTFLEPACGEGAFLVEILKRKLKMIEKEYNSTLEQYENYSLLALSTLYGIEILADNAQECAMQMYQVYLKYYNKQAAKHQKTEKSNVRKSARFIISKNIIQGNFLTKNRLDGSPIIFNKWYPKNLSRNPESIIVERTEYTLDEISNGIKKDSGDNFSDSTKYEQLDMFGLLEPAGNKEKDKVKYRYIPTKITQIYKEEMEEYYE